MKKVLLTALLISGAFFVNARGQRRAHPAQPPCIQEQIKNEQAKLTWPGFFLECIGLPERERLIAKANILRLQANIHSAEVRNIDTQNRVLESYKNNFINTVYGLRYPAMAAFIVASYYNSPAHDGTIPGIAYSGLVGTAETTKIVASTSYDVGSYVGTQALSAITAIAQYVGDSVDTFLQHRYEQK